MELVYAMPRNNENIKIKQAITKNERYLFLFKNLK